MFIHEFPFECWKSAHIVWNHEKFFWFVRLNTYRAPDHFSMSVDSILRIGSFFPPDFWEEVFFFRFLFFRKQKTERDFSIASGQIGCYPFICYLLGSRFFFFFLEKKLFITCHVRWEHSHQSKINNNLLFAFHFFSLSIFLSAFVQCSMFAPHFAVPLYLSRSRAMQLINMESFLF